MLTVAAMNIDSLKSLAGLIQNSLNLIGDVYAHNNADIPSLDHPFCATEEHTRGASLLADERVVEQVSIIVAAAAQLIASLRLPFLYLTETALAVSCYNLF